MLPVINPLKTTVYQENKKLRKLVRELTEKGLNKEARSVELRVKNIHEEIKAVTDGDNFPYWMLED